MKYGKLTDLYKGGKKIFHPTDYIVFISKRDIIGVTLGKELFNKLNESGYIDKCINEINNISKEEDIIDIEQELLKPENIELINEEEEKRSQSLTHEEKIDFIKNK